MGAAEGKRENELKPTDTLCFISSQNFFGWIFSWLNHLNLEVREIPNLSFWTSSTCCLGRIVDRSCCYSISFRLLWCFFMSLIRIREFGSGWTRFGACLFSVGLTSTGLTLFTTRFVGWFGQISNWIGWNFRPILKPFKPTQNLVKKAGLQVVWRWFKHGLDLV